MRKNDLILKDGNLYRVLDLDDDQSLLIDCKKQAMPQWCLFTEGELCDDEVLYSITGYRPQSFMELTTDQQRTAHERFTVIAPVLSFVGKAQERSAMIRRVSSDYGLSQQTVRSWLCRYLVYQDIAILAPAARGTKELSQDEKNMRWALNKYYYTKRKNPLTVAYTYLLREKYCDEDGHLLECYPSIHQFRYFKAKYQKKQTYYISREGIKAYQRNHRPLLGDGVQEYASAPGVAMLDSTTCDIYLVDDAGALVGRPILVAAVDAYSGLCLGYSLLWEGGTYSLRGLILNVIRDITSSTRSWLQQPL